MTADKWEENNNPGIPYEERLKEWQRCSSSME
jgi:hypothetical protein